MLLPKRRESRCRAGQWHLLNNGDGCMEFGIPRSMADARLALALALADLRDHLVPLTLLPICNSLHVRHHQHSNLLSAAQRRCAQGWTMAALGHPTKLQARSGDDEEIEEVISACWLDRAAVFNNGILTACIVYRTTAAGALQVPILRFRRSRVHARPS